MLPMLVVFVVFVVFIVLIVLIVFIRFPRLGWLTVIAATFIKFMGFPMTYCRIAGAIIMCHQDRFRTCYRLS